MFEELQAVSACQGVADAKAGETAAQPSRLCGRQTSCLRLQFDRQDGPSWTGVYLPTDKMSAPRFKKTREHFLAVAD